MDTRILDIYTTRTGVRCISDQSVNFLNSNLQTGITEMILCFIMKEGLGKVHVVIEHTVDCNCHTFSQCVAICANKGRDSA